MFPTSTPRTLAALACTGAFLVTACSSTATSAGAVDSEPSTSGVGENTTEEQPPRNSEEGAPVPPGTHTYDRGPFPVTYTTEETTYDMSRGWDTYRVVAMDPHGLLVLDFPVTAADLTRPPTDEVDEYGDYRVAGPIAFPEDVGAWLDDAIALTVVDEGTIPLVEGEASWWDLAVSEPEARCFEDGPTEPCVTLWPHLDGEPERQIGAWVSGTARLYAIDVADDHLMLVTEGFETPEGPDHLAGVTAGHLPTWLQLTDRIVSSVRLGGSS